MSDDIPSDEVLNILSLKTPNAFTIYALEVYENDLKYHEKRIKEIKMIISHLKELSK